MAGRTGAVVGATARGDRAAGRVRAGAPSPLAVSVALAALAGAAAVYGLAAGDAYRPVSGITRASWLAQDAVTLAALPVLLLAAWRARAGSLAAHVVWTGLLVWLAYGYAHLAFGAPFNVMFLAYVALLGLAGTALLDALLRVDVTRFAAAYAAAPARPAAWLLAGGGVGIAALWLADIVPGMAGDPPAGVHLAGLPHPTWVLDLAWIIPLAIAAAVMLRRRHPAAPLVAGALLVMLLALSASMLAIVPFALAGGLQRQPGVAAQLVVFGLVFAALAAADGWLLAAAHRRRRLAPGPWRRASWWDLRGARDRGAQEPAR